MSRKKDKRPGRVPAPAESRNTEPGSGSGASKTYEARGFNRASEATHQTVRRAASSFRLSLTLRIALHYCAQLARSFVLYALVVSAAFGLGLFLRYRAAAARISASAPDPATGEYSQAVLQNEDLTARLEPGLGPEENESSWKFSLRLLFSDRFPARIVWAVRTGETMVRVTADLREPGHAWLLLMIGCAAADLLRMILLIWQRRRLDRRVLAPIRDMTEMAQTLSAANLSNRINVAGTKNELKDLAVVINGMLDRIERSYNSQKQFVSDASHELRTPIAVIQGYADMLRRWGKDDPEVLEEGIEAISQETAGMKDLVENLLFLARHDKKTLMLEKSSFRADDLMREVQREASLVAPGDRFSLVPEDPALLYADRGLMKQLLRILVDNAVKYAPPGSEITLGVRQQPDVCVLSVSDQGCGISPEDLPRIFERFYRADEARHSETGGHGLGLSIARIIVVAHAGKIHVRSKPGVGTTFEIVLPLSAEPVSPVEPKAV